jgi:hypothetical protein
MKWIKLLLLVLVVGLLMVACNPFADEGVHLTADLSREEVVCERGPCGGEGTESANIKINSDRTRLCYRYEIGDFVMSGEEGTGAHIHSGAKGEVGPVVVDFISGNEACQEVSPFGLTQSVLRAITEEPANFYLDIHTERYPDGWVRG